MIVALADAKLHLGLTGEDPETDVLVTAKIEAAQAFIERRLGFDIEATYGGTGQDQVPAPLYEAVLQLTAAWFENREASIVGVTAMEMPLSVADIINEYRAWSF